MPASYLSNFSQIKVCLIFPLATRARPASLLAIAPARRYCRREQMASTGKAVYKAVVFDLDGTLTVPTLDFNAMRAEIGIAAGDLTTEIPKLSPDAQKLAWAVIQRHEEEAIARQTPQPGALELLNECRLAGILMGIVTRNTRRSINHFMARFKVDFDGIITREEPPLKPHPDSVLRLLTKWNVKPPSTLVVGDYRHDIEAGRRAGTRTCFYQNKGVPFSGDGADFVVNSMRELHSLIFS